MNYCLAVALLHDRLTLGDFTPAPVMRPDIRALLPLTRMTTYAEDYERVTPGRLPHELTLRLRDGTELRASRVAAKGTLAFPPNEADRQNKFFDCAARAISLPTAQHLFSRMGHVQSPGTVNLLQDVDWT